MSGERQNPISGTNKESKVGKGTLRRLTIAIMATLVLAATVIGAAHAAKVANPGNVALTFQSGELTIRDESFDAASSSDPATASGTVAANGNITLTSFNFPDLPPVDGPFGDVNVTINVIGTPTGNVNPFTGAMNLTVVLRIDADGGGVGSDCHIGNITLNLTTGTKPAFGSVPAMTGVPYNTANGSFTLVDNAFSVPGASGCTSFPVNVNNFINDEFGLPSPAGNNTVRLSAVSRPILQKAIVPSFTATPSAGSAPLPVNFDASSTFHSRPVASYQWDLDGNGSLETTTSGPTTSFTYTTPGTRTVKLRVTDVDGDFQETTRQVVVSAAPDLSIAKSHTGDFVSGQTDSYSIAVSNTGSFPATDPITVTDTLPADMAFAGSTSAGWSCGSLGQVVTCTSQDNIGVGGSAPPLSLDVTPGPASVGFVTNTATVDVNGDANATNDTAEDVTRVLQAGIDLELTKTIDQDDGLFRGRRATYILGVTNVGTASAVDRIRIVDQLPAGVSFVSAAGGLDWTCSFGSGEVRCFSDEDLAGGDSLQDVRIRVDVDTNAPSSVLNTASVSVNGDANAANDSAEHAGTPEGYATDYALTKSHSGEFVVGEPGFYNLQVQNVGFATGGGQVSILDQLPSGLSFDSASGEGWNCGAVDQDVTCTHAGQVEAGDNLPTLTLKVSVGSAALGTVTNMAGVSSSDDGNTANDVASDPTVVRNPQPDLIISKAHQGNFTGGQQGTYTIVVSNAGEFAPGPTTVTDTLPAGMSFASASGSGWSCSSAPPQVTCTFAGGIAGGASAPPITLVVNTVQPSQDTTLTNTATVSNAADVNASNNSASDPTLVGDAQIDTKLEAHALLVEVHTGRIRVLQGPNATLTTLTGTPIPNKLIVFKTRLNNRTLCQARTNAQGEAKCSPALLWLRQAINAGSFRYHAFFAGDAQYEPASTTDGQIIDVLGGPEPGQP